MWWWYPPAETNAAWSPEPIHQLEPENARPEAECAIEIGDLEMNVPDPDTGIDHAVRLLQRPR